MKVFKMSSLTGTDRQVHCPRGEFISLRGLIKSDGMGYSVTKTIVSEGGPYLWHYKNHLESCYCISGKGILRDSTGNTYEVSPDTLYVLDKNDKHFFTASEETVLLCVFNPPLNGPEVHNNDGSYDV